MEGWCLVEGVIPKNHVNTIRKEVITANEKAAQEYESWGGSLAHQWGPREEVGKNVVAYIPSLAAYFGDKRVVGIAQAMLDPHVRIAQTEFKTRQPNEIRNKRSFHSDWPHDLTDRDNAGAVFMPFPDVTMGLTTLWMLSSFSEKKGGTWVVPRSHRDLRNPLSHLDPRNPPGLHDDIDGTLPIPGEIQLFGSAGSVVMLDSRIWHSVASNPSPEPRVTVLTRYSPWWINLELGGRNQAIVPKMAYEALPDDVKLLYRHRAEGEKNTI